MSPLFASTRAWSCSGGGRGGLAVSGFEEMNVGGRGLALELGGSGGGRVEVYRSDTFALVATEKVGV